MESDNKPINGIFEDLRLPFGVGSLLVLLAVGSLAVKPIAAKKERNHPALDISGMMVITKGYLLVNEEISR